MTRRHVIGTVLLLALLAAHSCHPVEEQEQASEPIVFSAVVSGDMPATKAEGMMDDTGLKAAGFGVFACYTGLRTYTESSVSSNFMHNQPLAWDGQRWTYDPLKYWPGEEDHHVSFFAYAPYSDGSNECISSFCHVQEQSDPWILYRLAENVDDQVDLLYATPQLNLTRSAANTRVPFSFQHALACVGDTVTVQCSDELIDRLQGEVTSGSSTYIQILLKEISIDYTLTAKGRLVLWTAGGANWKTVSSEEALVRRSVVCLSDSEYPVPLWDSDTGAATTWTKEGLGIFCIPVEAPGYAQKASINISYYVGRVSGGDTFWVERSITKDLPLAAYVKAGKELDIQVSLTNL